MLKAVSSILMLSLPLIAAGTQTAYSGDSISGITDRTLSESVSTASLFEHVYTSPVMAPLRRDWSINTAGITWEQRTNRHGRPYNQAMGRSLHQGSFSAESYIKHGRSTLWGHARYMTGKIKSMEWCETSDLEIVYPYILADATGGNLSKEVYSFGGGAASTTGKWSYGAAISYRAGLYYRNVDPRPRNVTGLLNLTVGSGIMTGSHMISAGIHVDKYKQTNSLECLSEFGTVKIYHLTGLGTDYRRFAGVGSSTYYTGWRYGARLDMHPLSMHHGPVLSLSVSRFTLSNILSDLNKLPLASVREMTYRAQAGWKWRHGGVLGHIDVTRRLGDENIFGDASSGSYPRITSLTLYAHNHISAGAAASASTPISRHLWANIETDASFEHDNQVQAAAHARRTVNHLSMHLNAHLTWQAKHGNLFQIGALLGRRQPLDSLFAIPNQGEAGAINAAMTGFLADSRLLLSAGGNLTATFRLSHSQALRVTATAIRTSTACSCILSSAIVF